MLCIVLMCSDYHDMTFEGCSSPPQLTDALMTMILNCLYIGISGFFKKMLTEEPLGHTEERLFPFLGVCP